VSAGFVACVPLVSLFLFLPLPSAIGFKAETAHPARKDSVKTSTPGSSFVVFKS
jgi:hypothetical protein